MNILFVSRRYYPDVVGGGEISAHELAKALRQAGQNVRVLTFTTEGKRIDEVLDGVHVTRMPIRQLRWFPRFSNLEWMYYEMGRCLRQFLREWKPDILHALNGESAPSVAWVAKRTGIPYVVTANGPLLFCFPGEGTDAEGRNCFGCHGWQRFREIMHRWGNRGFASQLKAFFFWLYSYPHMALFSWSVRNAAKILPISNGLKSTLKGLGYPDRQLDVVHNPIKVAPIKKTARNALRIPKSNKVLLYVGRLAPNKGIDRMIRALPQLKDAHVVIVGKGAFEPELRALAQQLGVSDRIHFVGFVTPGKTQAYYAAADVVIMAGTFYESLGRMLMEASAAGVPVIGTHRGGIPDVIEHGKTGYLLETDRLDELVTRIQDAFRQKTVLGRCGIQKMKSEFSHARVAESLAKAYQSVV